MLDFLTRMLILTVIILLGCGAFVITKRILSHLIRRILTHSTREILSFTKAITTVSALFAIISTIALAYFYFQGITQGTARQNETIFIAGVPACKDNINIAIQYNKEMELDSNYIIRINATRSSDMKLFKKDVRGGSSFVFSKADCSRIISFTIAEPYARKSFLIDDSLYQKTQEVDDTTVTFWKVGISPLIPGLHILNIETTTSQIYDDRISSRNNKTIELEINVLPRKSESFIKRIFDQNNLGAWGVIISFAVLLVAIIALVIQALNYKGERSKTHEGNSQQEQMKKPLAPQPPPPSAPTRPKKKKK